MLALISWPWRKPAFFYPLQPPPRTAVLVPWFRSNGTIRVFPDGWSEQVRRFAPEAVAATLAELDRLTRARMKLSHAVIVLHCATESPLSDAGRERLWDTFRVPVFEQIVGDHGKLLAAECEAHDGLHVEHPLPCAGEACIDTSPCACGGRTPRIFPAGRREPVGRLAAFTA